MAITIDGSANTIAGLAVGGVPDNTIDNGCLADDAVGIADLSATGTASSSTYLRGDNTWATVSAGISSDSNDNVVGGDAAGGNISGSGYQNTCIGDNAGNSITDGDNNVAIGYYALDAVTTSNQNVGIGSEAGQAITGASNVAIGFRAAEDATSINSCVAVGPWAFDGANTGDKNIAIGESALGNAATTGGDNIAIGVSALASATSADGNIAIGYQAMTACTTQGYTTAVGYRALATMSAGSTGNVAIGYKAMEDVTIADDGVAVGYGALQNLTEGVKNVAVGAETLATVTTGQKNTGIGYLALYKETTSDNTAVGYMALYNHETNGKNTAVGAECLNSTVSGTEATAIGYQAGNDYTANGGVFVGRQAGKTNATSQDTILYIARNADSAGNNGCWIYGNDIGQCFNGDNSSSWNTTSDQRLKKDIVDNNVGLSVIDNVKVRNFKYKQYNKDEEGDVTTPKTSDDTIDLSGFVSGTTAGNVVIGQGKTGTQIGVIAQEIEAVCPGCVKTDDFGAKTVNTDELFWHMINAIKELSTKVKALEAA